MDNHGFLCADVTCEYDNIFATQLDKWNTSPKQVCIIRDASISPPPTTAPPTATASSVWYGLVVPRLTQLNIDVLPPLSITTSSWLRMLDAANTLWMMLCFSDSHPIYRTSLMYPMVTQDTSFLSSRTCVPASPIVCLHPIPSSECKSAFGQWLTQWAWEPHSRHGFSALGPPRPPRPPRPLPRPPRPPLRPPLPWSSALLLFGSSDV